VCLNLGRHELSFIFAKINFGMNEGLETLAVTKGNWKGLSESTVYGI